VELVEAHLADSVGTFQGNWQEEGGKQRPDF